MEIEQIFSNLLSNALYEMPKGGKLTVRLAADEKWLYITVADSGGGISEEDLGRIFEPFFTTKAKGTGFGLSVVLRIVKAYSGHIRVESETGKGASFTIELPLPQ
jgi:signal transduction histidine kinase